ncbi:tape measure protein [Sphingorhabdus sp. 109]|uniref:tape measure protein n=1 Tax=Sphingorhabdus sp. 109 TaxID=2653173 RepID=UPI0012F13BCC|nr:tape measure protein [Sphingorhabdus sp. 109]VWX62602.1 conserved hypothetical protein [Sphingorhabdus sp. 109]
MALKLSLILQAIDKMSGPTRKAAGGYSFMDKAIAKASGTSAKLARSQEHLERRLRRNKRLAKGRFYQAFTQSTASAARRVRSFTRDLKLNERAMKLAKRAAGGFASKLGSSLKYGALAAGAAGGYAIFDMFRVASDFEQFQIMLEGTEGSAKKAKKAMGWVQDFASSTPYELNDVMAAYVQLRAYGIDPTTGALRSLGDAASGMNKDLMQAVEAMADAQTGEFERLKEFAIKSKSEGDKVTFSYIKNGRTLTKTVKKDAAEIQAALTGIFDERFGGGMERQSKTLKGLLSNLKDQWAKFQLQVADAGIFDKVKDGAQRLLDKVGEMASDGRLERWAEKISKALEKAWDMGVKFVERTDWEAVARGLGTTVDVLMKIIGLIGKAQSAYERFSKWKAGNQLETVENSRADFATKNRVRKVYNQQFGTRPVKRSNPFGGTRPGSVRYAPSGKTRPLSSSAPGNNVRVSGKTEVEISVNGPAKARVKKTSSQGSDVAMSVTLGKSNALAA